MTRFESSVKVIPYAQARVYEKVSNLENIESVKDKLPAEAIKNISFDAETVTFNVPPVGTVKLQVVEREPYKLIKFETVSSPIHFYFWIQIVPTAEEECKVRLTTDVEVNPFMKGMIKKPLQEALEKMADMMAAIQY
jgi:hypothetical protein